MPTPPNLMDPAVRADPYPLYAELRRGPVRQVEPGGMWAVSRYDDIIAALRDPRLSAAANAHVFQPPWLGPSVFGQTLLTMDPPQHTRLRALVQPAFTASGLAWMEARIRSIAEALARELMARREVDAVADWALPLPTRVMGELLGLPSHLHPRIKPWAELHASIPILQPTPEEIVRIKAELAEEERLLRDLIASRRRQPEDDLLTRLMTAQLDGRPLEEDELVGFVNLLMLAGVETTTHLLSSALLLLSGHPDVLGRVRADPGRLIPAFVEEVLRLEPPAHTIFRWTTAPVELGGATLPAGATVALLLAAAARDERHYPDPEQLRLDRDEPTQIVFGHGPHFCLGAVLTRLEARIALEALLPRIRGVSRRPGGLRWSHSLSVRGVDALPVTLEPG